MLPLIKILPTIYIIFGLSKVIILCGATSHFCPAYDTKIYCGDERLFVLSASNRLYKKSSIQVIGEHSSGAIINQLDEAQNHLCSKYLTSGIYVHTTHQALHFKWNFNNTEMAWSFIPKKKYFLLPPTYLYCVFEVANADSFQVIKLLWDMIKG